jgi:hypothetical protein
MQVSIGIHGRQRLRNKVSNKEKVNFEEEQQVDNPEEDLATRQRLVLRCATVGEELAVDTILRITSVGRITVTFSSRSARGLVVIPQG